MTQALMAAKRGLIMGVANSKSIAWGIAQAVHAHGAQLAFTYKGEAIKRRIVPLAAKVGSDIVLECDVSSDLALDATFSAIKKQWGKLDFLVHAIACSDKNELQGRYINTGPDNFTRTMNISAYSFTATTQRAQKLMHNGGSIITITYAGSKSVVPNYNIMGVAKAALECSVKYLAADLGPKNIRVNAISAGPIKTLAASGVGSLRQIIHENKKHAPLRRATTLEDVGNAGLYLLSDISSGTTGEILNVDCGYSISGT